MSKFKVGDKVIINGPAWSAGIKHSIGSIGEIISIDVEDDAIYVRGDYKEDPLWWYLPSSLQLKSEYDMNNKNNTETNLSHFDMECAKKGDLIVCDADKGVYMLTNKNAGETVHIFQLEVNGGEEQAIMSFHEESNTWFHGFLSKRCESPVFMAPVEKTGWIALYRGRYDDSFIRTISCTHVFDTEKQAIDGAIGVSDRFLICTKHISWTE